MRTSLLAGCLALGGSLTTAAARAEEGPRYLLATGRELAYHNEARTGPEGSARVYVVDWKVWAIGRDADGGWRVVIRCDLKTRRESAGKPPEDDEVDTILWRCRLFDDGRLVGATTRGTVRDPFRIFPKLPAGPDERAKGWDSPGSEMDGVTLHHALATAEGDRLGITTRGESPMDKVYGESQEYRATFDARRGLVTRVETDDASEYPRAGRTRGAIELVGVEERGSAWASTFGAEADRYFAAVADDEATARRAAGDPARCEALLVEGNAKLAAARATLATPAFAEAIARRVIPPARIKRAVAEAEEQAARIGKEAEAWEARDVDGKVHRLADYRGKVVVMDFWYRGCGWCMHAMPQLIRLADDFRDRPVALLGMTIDKDERDARAVIDAMRPSYPTIKAAEIAERYAVSAYPTLVVVDRAGKVRAFRVGYSPDLRDDLSALIRGLLAETGDGR